jgi:hypothetical protein
LAWREHSPFSARPQSQSQKIIGGWARNPMSGERESLGMIGFPVMRMMDSLRDSLKTT